MHVTLTARQRKKLMDLLPKLFTLDELATILYTLHLNLERIAGDKPARDAAIRKVLEQAERLGTLSTVLDAFATHREKSVELRVLASEVNEAERILDLSEASTDLVTILTEEDVPDDLLMQAFSVTAPPFIQRTVNPRTTADVKNAVVTKLAGELDRSPLVKFAQLLKLLLDQGRFAAAVDRLTVWIRTAMIYLGITEHQKQLLDDAIEAELNRRAQQRLHLLASVKPTLGAAGDYEINVWSTWVDPVTGKAQRWLPQPRTLCKREEIGREIVRAVWLVADDLFKDSPMPTLELFLPLDLLHIDPDRWDLSDDDLPEPLGSRFSVLLRSWERSYETGYKFSRTRADWHTLWNERRTHGTKGVCLAVAPDPKVYSPWTRLERISCAALTFPPDRTTVRAIVMSGTPIVLWIRSDISACRDSVTTFFSDIAAKQCEDFRSSIVEARLRAAAAGADAVHFGHHLNLLWDDPERQPPDSIENAMMME
jgi:vWA-MoxR associated protein C-terminal domain